MWLALTAAAVGLGLWHYHRRETPGRGRTSLAVLRALALSLLLLLLLDPSLPATSPEGVRGSQVLLDASLSMTLPEGTDGETRWQRAAAEARNRAGDRPVLLFGERTRPVHRDSLPERAPGDHRSRLMPALQAAAEAGVRRVIVVTDGSIEDAEAVARWAPRLGLEIEPVPVGGETANRSLIEVQAPSWVESGQPALIEFGVAGARDTVGVTARRNGAVVGRTAVAPAAPGRLSTGRLELSLDPPPGGGLVRLELALDGEDVVPDDDRRTVYIHVSDEPAGVVLVSFRPDWEPRFLTAVLEQALGLPMRAWLRASPSQYVRLGTGLQAGGPATEADVRRALERAELVVFHGIGRDAPEWARATAASARRVLLFPTEVDGVDLPLQIGTEQPGDYYPSPAIPPSPVAPLLADADIAGASPLTGLRPADLPPGAWSPLLVTRGRQGQPLPVIAAAEQAGRRWAVALGSGYWNWAFRGGAERQLYERLWGSVAGWLVRERATASLAAVRPATPARPRGAPVPWLAAGVAADSIRVTLTDEAGTAVQDTVIERITADTAFATAPAPGHYGYRAQAFVGDTIIEATGPLTIEWYSPELARPAVDPASLRATASLVRSDDGPARGRALHATAWPYVLLLAFLATEWILRRRWGLR